MSRGRKVPSELQRLLDTSPDAVLLVDRTGSIVALNGRAEASSGTGSAGFWLRPVAEAEDDGAIAALRAIGVDLAQGFCIGRPEPFETALDRLAVLNPAP